MKNNKSLTAAGSAAAAGFFVAMVVLASEAPAHATEPSASDCVSVLRTEQAKGLDMSVTNACGRGLSCEMRWTLSCESLDGKVTAKAAKASRFTIDASGQSQVTASASVCKDSWTVTDVTWSCSGR